MEYDVLVKREKGERYSARVLLLPEIVVSGDSEDNVLEQVKAAIIDLRSSSRIVPVSVPSLDEEKSNPWLRYAGLWADDPDWEVFQEEMRAYRREIDSDPKPESE